MDRQPNTFKKNLSDETIDHAFDNLPKEVQDETIDQIKQKLKLREQLVKYASSTIEYYKKRF
jgi:hypothetical protein